MMVRVKVKGSPYRAVKRGVVGEVVERKYVGTTYEILKVRLPGGAEWAFHPDELEALDGAAV